MPRQVTSQIQRQPQKVGRSISKQIFYLQYMGEGDARLGLFSSPASMAGLAIEEPIKIAQVAPLIESCPPRFYGGTERVVSYLTEELVRLGHEVTLFASGDSQTSAVLEPGCHGALRLDTRCRDPFVYLMAMLYRIRRRADEFDLLHFHTDYFHFPLFADIGHKTLTTLHGRLDGPDLPVAMREFPAMPLASISQAQRSPMPWANWQGTVLHGLPPDLSGVGDGSITSCING